MYRLLEFFSYVALLSHRFTNDYLPLLQETKSPQSSVLIRELKGMLELYSTYQPDYDYFDYKNGPTFKRAYLLYLPTRISVLKSLQVPFDEHLSLIALPHFEQLCLHHPFFLQFVSIHNLVDFLFARIVRILTDLSLQIIWKLW